MGKLFGRRASDAFDKWRSSTAMGPLEPAPQEPDELPSPAAEPVVDWTTAPAGEVPPWRQEDRALVDAARSAAAAAPPDDEAAAALARDLRRLAALSGDEVLTDREYLAAVRARLARSSESRG